MDSVTVTLADESLASASGFQLENLAHLEEMFVEFGKEDGLRDGIRAGFVEGRALGRQKSFPLASEFGFYAGCASAWLALDRTRPGLLTSKEQTQLAAVEQMCAEFASRDLSGGEYDPVEALEKVRNKWKILASHSALIKGQPFRETKASALSF